MNTKKLSDLDDDSVLDDNDTINKIEVLCVTKNPDVKNMMMSLASLSTAIKIDFLNHGGEVEHNIDKYGCITFECRLLEGYQDVQSIRGIRQKRPLIPIIAFNNNQEPSFLVSLYKSGVTDSVGTDIIDEVFLQKIICLHRLSESARLVEVQNQQLIETMKAQRLANERRLKAEKDKAQAVMEAQANRQTKEILDNLNKGFFIIDKNLIIGDAASTTCKAIFSRDIAGLPLGDALNLAHEKERFMRICLSQIFDDVLPLNVSMELLPKDARTKDGKIVELNYTCLTDAENKPFKIITVATDATENILERQRLKEAEMLNLCLINILKNKDAFRKYLSDTREEITTLLTCEDPIVGKRLLHTIKGNSAAFGLERLSKRIHDIESYLAEKPDNVTYASVFTSSANEIQDSLNTFINDNQEVLKIDMDNLTSQDLKVDSNVFVRIQEIAQKAPPVIKAEIIDILNSVTSDPFESAMAFFKSSMQKVAAEQRKLVDFRFKNTDLHFDQNKFQKLYKSLIHAVTNTCTHGIELPEIRKENGKDPRGFLQISLLPTANGELNICIQDDGQGLDADRILQKALEKNLITAERAAKLNQDEIYQFIFLDGFSTRESADHSSGRGIGMAAIKGEVEALRGKIVIKSEKGKGTTFNLLIPEVFKVASKQKRNKEKLSILISDDEPDIINIYKEILNSPKYELITSTNGLDAILELSKRNFDLFITDLNMPGLQGISIVKKIESLMGEKARMPIIVISGYLSEERLKELSGYPQIKVLEKPIRFSLLQEAVETLLASDSAA